MSIHDEHRKFQASQFSLLYYTVSSRLYAQFSTACIPLFASNVILKSCFTQCESWITITLTPSYSLISLETLCAYMREDTVFSFTNHFHLSKSDEFQSQLASQSLQQAKGTVFITFHTLLTILAIESLIFGVLL